MTEPAKEEIVFHGIAASPGVVHGRAYLYQPNELDVPCYSVESDNLDDDSESDDEESDPELSKLCKLIFLSLFKKITLLFLFNITIFFCLKESSSIVDFLFLFSLIINKYIFLFFK